MKKQDRIAVCTPQTAVQVSRAEQKKLEQTMKGLVSFRDLMTPGQTQIHGGNITTGSISADRITAGVLRSRDGKSILLDLDQGRADITGSVNLAGWSGKGDLVGSLRPGVLQIALTGVPYPGGEVGILQQVELMENSLVFSNPVTGKTLTLKLENDAGRLSGLAAPEQKGDAVNLEYLNQRIDALREELGLPVG